MKKVARAPHYNSRLSCDEIGIIPGTKYNPAAAVTSDEEQDSGNKTAVEIRKSLGTRKR